MQILYEVQPSRLAHTHTNLVYPLHQTPARKIYLRLAVDSVGGETPL